MRLCENRLFSDDRAVEPVTSAVLRNDQIRQTDRRRAAVDARDEDRKVGRPLSAFGEAEVEQIVGRDHARREREQTAQDGCLARRERKGVAEQGRFCAVCRE